MKDKALKISKQTSKALENVATVVALSCGLAAALKVVGEPKVSTGIGNLPVWQGVASVMLVLILGYIFVLLQRVKE